MATLNTAGLPTLLDLMMSLDPDGTPAEVVELLQRSNPLIEDMFFKEGNHQTGHQVTARLSLPSASWRLINKGIDPSKGAKTQVLEQAGILETRSQIDVKEVEMNGGVAYRADEDMAHTVALANEAETAFFYASTAANPEKIQGLSNRYDSTAASAGGSNIVLHTGGASGNDQTSIWLVGHGPRTVFGFWPKGMKGGISKVDMGQQYVEDSDGKLFRAWCTDWSWNMGMAVADWRSVVRIANIDTSAISGDNFDIVPAMIQAFHKIPAEIRNTTRLRWYCNRTMETYLHLQASKAIRGAGPLTVEEIAGKPVTFCLGAPIRCADAILNTESVIS